MVAPSGDLRPRPGSPGALVVESHHPYRPSLMVGACIRGTFEASKDARLIAERYGIGAEDVPPALELQPERVTSWRGFAITSSAPKAARRLRVAQG